MHVQMTIDAGTLSEAVGRLFEVAKIPAGAREVRLKAGCAGEVIVSYYIDSDPPPKLSVGTAAGEYALTANSKPS